MALDSKTILEKSRVELVISVAADKFEEAVKQAYFKNKLEVPGFRKGKAPRRIIETMYGPDVFYNQAIDALYPAAYDEAIEEAAIEPVDKADLEIIEAGKDGFKFKATVTVEPEVTVKEYKGLKVEKTVFTADDSDVETALKAEQKKLSRLVELDSEAITQDGDTAVFDFDGYVDGEPFEGGKASDYQLVLGSKQFIPGFEEQMLGKKTGEEFSVNVTFPADYHEEKLQSKPAEFKVVLHEIKREELPEINDDFAKDVSDFDTLEEYKADLLKQAQERKDKQSDNMIDSDIDEKIIELLDTEIPECMINNEVNAQLQDFEQRFASQGISLEMYMKYTGQTLDGMREQFRPGAERQVKLRLALKKIAELEGIVISQEEIDEEYRKYAEEYKIDIEKYRGAVMDENITKELCIRKAHELVKNFAEISTITAEEAAARAKAEAEAEKEKAEAAEATEDAGAADTENK